MLLGIWLPWKVNDGKDLNSTFITSTASSLQHCMEQCLEETGDSSECRAIIINTKTQKDNCRYESLKTEDPVYTTLPGSNWQHFERPGWYLGKLASFSLEKTLFVTRYLFLIYKMSQSSKKVKNHFIKCSCTLLVQEHFINMIHLQYNNASA